MKMLNKKYLLIIILIALLIIGYIGIYANNSYKSSLSYKLSQQGFSDTEIEIINLLEKKMVLNYNDPKQLSYNAGIYDLLDNTDLDFLLKLIDSYGQVDIVFNYVKAHQSKISETDQNKIRLHLFNKLKSYRAVYSKNYRAATNMYDYQSRPYVIVGAYIGDQNREYSVMNLGKRYLKIGGLTISKDMVITLNNLIVRYNEYPQLVSKNEEEALINVLQPTEEKVLDKFKTIPTNYALELINKGYSWYVVKNISKINNGDRAFIVETIYNTKKGNSKNAILFNIDDFNKLPTSIITGLINDGYGEKIIENINKFPQRDREDIIIQVYQAGYQELIKQNIDKFVKFSKEFFEQIGVKDTYLISGSLIPMGAISGVFDACGYTKKYKFFDRYKDLQDKFDDIKMNLEPLDGENNYRGIEMCYSPSLQTVIINIPLIPNPSRSGYQLPLNIYKYDIQQGALEKAKLYKPHFGASAELLKNPEYHSDYNFYEYYNDYHNAYQNVDFSEVVTSFGPRKGYYIELYGGYGDAGCSSNNTYRYYYSDNLIKKESSCGGCRNEETNSSDVKCEYFN